MILITLLLLACVYTLKRCFTARKSSKNYLIKDLNKKNLDEHDIALIVFCTNLGINLQKEAFFDSEVLKEVKSDYTFVESIRLIFSNISTLRNHDKIALQYLIKVMQIPSKIVDDLDFEQLVSSAFTLISKHYYNQNKFRQFKNYCHRFIKTDWKQAFVFYSTFASFYMSFWDHWVDYNREQTKKPSYNLTNYNIAAYYKLFGVNHAVDKTTIKKKYRELSLKYHPDVGGSNEDFLKIQEAYRYLMKTH